MSHHCLRCMTRSAGLSFVLPKHECIGVNFLITVTMYLTHSIMIEEWGHFGSWGMQPDMMMEWVAWSMQPIK